MCASRDGAALAAHVVHCLCGGPHLQSLGGHMPLEAAQFAHPGQEALPLHPCAPAQQPSSLVCCMVWSSAAAAAAAAADDDDDDDDALLKNSAPGSWHWLGCCCHQTAPAQGPLPASMQIK